MFHEKISKSLEPVVHSCLTNKIFWKFQKIPRKKVLIVAETRNISKHRLHRFAFLGEFQKTPELLDLKAMKRLEWMENMKRKKSFDLWFSFPDMTVIWKHCLKKAEKLMILKNHLLEKSVASVDIIGNIDSIASSTW